MYATQYAGKYGPWLTHCSGCLSAFEKFKFIDNLSVVEVINLISIGLASYNCRNHVPSDVATSISSLTRSTSSRKGILTEFQIGLRARK
jgi:hypothetical protein